MSYNPKPTRVWSRVQHPCTFTVDSSYNSAFSPLTGRTTSLLEADYYNKLLYKGNILQYKKNTSNLTKSQRYSQICKGMWTNRTKSYATQTQTYTNPNTSNLKQVNFINVPTNGVTTYIPGPFNFNIPAPNGCPSNVIKEGGSLLCNTVVNPCTDEEIKTTTVLECYPTYCSDVPGPVIDLCWNPKLDTWYPRQNLTMNNSTDKWPEGYKGFVSAVRPDSGVLSLLSLINTNATLNWSIVNNDCIPISSYNIYENGRLIANVPYPTNTFTYTNCDTNTFYVTSISGTTESEPSNIVTVTSPPQQLEAPVLSLDSSTATTATFSWTFVNNDCIPISSFNIYENDTVIPIANVAYPTNTDTFTVCGGNTFYVTSLSGTTESQLSNPVAINLPITPPVLTGVNNNNDTATLSWTINTPCNITEFNIYNTSTGFTITVNYPTNTFTAPLSGGNNSFYVTATVSGGNTSGSSNTVTVYNPSRFVPVNGTVSSSGNNYTVTFTQYIGSITFYNNFTPINVILVGGGGGASGGGRVSAIFAIDGGGGGGGGETLSFTQSSYTNGTTYNVTIGPGGTGGSWDSIGIYTFPISGSQSTIFSNRAHGGYAPVFIGDSGGGGGIPNPAPPPFTLNGGPYVIPPNTGGGTNGNSGTALAITNGTSYGGGSGGSGSYATATYPPNYTLVAGGGGGGTGYPSIAVGQGGGGGNGGSAGVGGTNSGGAGAPSNGSNGQNATSYGGGGGGGSGEQASGIVGNGGNGGNGICVLTFSLTYPP